MTTKTNIEIDMLLKAMAQKGCSIHYDMKQIEQWINEIRLHYRTKKLLDIAIENYYTEHPIKRSGRKFESLASYGPYSGGDFSHAHSVRGGKETKPTFLYGFFLHQCNDLDSIIPWIINVAKRPKNILRSPPVVSATQIINRHVPSKSNYLPTHILPSQIKQTTSSLHKASQSKQQVENSWKQFIECIKNVGLDASNSNRVLRCAQNYSAQIIEWADAKVAVVEEQRDLLCTARQINNDVAELSNVINRFETVVPPEKQEALAIDLLQDFGTPVHGTAGFLIEGEKHLPGSILLPEPVWQPQDISQLPKPIWEE